MKKIIMLILCVLLIGCAGKVEEEAETEVTPEEELSIEEKEPEPEPTILLRKGFLFEYSGRDFILVDVSPQETFCRIRVDQQTLTITKGTERSAYGLTIRVINASIEPNRVCEVEIR